MRSSDFLSPVILLVVAAAAAMEAGAIRLDVQTRASVVRSNQMLPTDVNKPSEDMAVKGSSTATSSAVGNNTKRITAAVAGGEVRAVAHKLPEFHEDYYGPSDHSPRHH